jgi:phage terminase large subunit-like protein
MATVEDKWIRNKSDEVAIENGCYFDDDSANHVCAFFESFLVVPDGRFAGEKITLIEWQRDYLSRLFGWKRKDGTRRFRRSNLFVAKKNSKSFLCSGIAAYMGVADGELSPNIVIAASSRDQAKIVYKSAKTMVKSSPPINKLCRIVDSRSRIEIPSTGGEIYVVSSDADRQEGLNSSAVLIDELHGHKNRALYDCLLYAGEARKQPLLIVISTAGSDKNHFCYEEWIYTDKVIKGDIIDTEILPVIYSADGMDPMTREAWYAANPSLGKVLLEEDFENKLNSAKESPIKWTSFLRYRLNMWTDSDKAWLNMDSWAGCTNDLDKEMLKGEVCYGGLDLSHKQDLTAFVLYFPKYKAFLCWAWTTSYQVNLRNQKNKASYLRFIEDGHLVALEGKVINQDFMKHKICDLAKEYKIEAIAQDPWCAQQIALELEDEGLDMASFRQGYGSLSEPTKLFEEMVLEQSIEHFNNPLLRWTASNCMVTQDPAGNIKPDKDKSHEMIDPILCCIMALGLANISRPTGPSIYETRGVLRF